MARSEGLALAPWGVLGGGKIRTNAEEARRKESGEKGRTILGPNWERSPEEKKVCDVLEEIAKEVNCESITAGMSRFCIFSVPKIPVFDLTQTAFACSCHCVPSAQDSLRVPHYWWPESRTASAKPLGTRHFTDP